MINDYIQTLLSLRQNLAAFSDYLNEYIAKNKPEEEITEEIKDNIDIEKEITTQKKMIEQNQKWIDELQNQFCKVENKYNEALKKKDNVAKGAKKLLIVMSVYFIIIGVIFFLMPLGAVGVMLGVFHIIGGLTILIGIPNTVKKALSKATYEFNVVDREYSQLKYKMDSYKENIESAKYNIKKYQLIKSKKEEVKKEKQETSTDLFKNYIKEFFSILNEKYNNTNILNIKYWPYINEVINYCLENENSNYDLIDFEIIKNQYKIKNDKYDNYITLLNKEENNIFNMYNSYVYSKLQIFELQYGNPFSEGKSLEIYINNKKYNDFELYNFKDIITKYYSI